MEFKILGPMEVFDGLRPVHIPGAKPRAVLAMLLLRANQVVSVDQLMDQVWSGAPPPAAATTLRGHVWALRRAIEPDRPSGEPSRLLLTHGPGYLLAVEEDQVDAARFERLAKEGHRCLVEGDAHGALTRLTQALGLWRGSALADFAFEDFAQAEAARLEELRLTATEDQMQAALECREHASVVAELQRLVKSHPLRERLRGLLMVALYRAGRQADALAVYREGRQVLVEELGVDSSRELQALEEAILRHDELLASHTSAPPRRGSGPTEEHWERRSGREPPLVGRDAELAVLSELLEAARQGSAGVALIEGPAGIGKTRLLGEVLMRARARGFDILYSRAEELERSRPFGVLRNALACQPSSPDRDLALVARLVGEDADPQHSGPGVEFRVIELLARVVENRARVRPLVVALEDLHWADPSTVAAFRWLGRRLPPVPLLLLGTFRPAPVRSELLGLVEAFSEERATHVPLVGLDEPAVEELVSRVVGAAPGPVLRRRVAGAAGNPLFVLELLRALSEEDRIRFEGARAETENAAVPPSLRPVVLRRLRPFAEGTVEVLRLASVLGSTFSVGDLAAVSGRSAFDLLSALGPAMRAGLIREGHGQLAFEHDLVREAVYDDLPHAVRDALHQDVGRALARAGAPVSTVATHLALGAAPGDAEAVRWAQRAAQEVIGTSPVVAAEFLQRALALTPPADPGRPALMSELASALMWAGRVTDGAAVVKELLALEHEPVFEAGLRLALGRALMMLGQSREAVTIDETGADLLGIPEWQRLQLRADASFATMLSGDMETAANAATSVLASSRGRADDVIVATSALSAVAMFSGQLADAVVLGQQVVDAVDRSWDPWIRHFPSHYWLALALILADRFPEAEQVIDAGRRRARERGNVWVLPGLHGASALSAFLAGRWDDAVEQAHCAIALSGDVGARHGLVFAHTTLSHVALCRGDLSAAHAALDVATREPDLPYFMSWIAHARALVEEARGATPLAFGVLAGAWEDARNTGITCAYPTLGPDLVRLALGRGEVALASLVTQEVEQAAARMGTRSAAAAAMRCRGLVERDTRVLLQAVATARRSPRPVERASVCEEAAAFVRETRPTEAVALLEEALAIHRSVHATRRAGHVAEQLQRLGRVATLSVRVDT